MSFGEKSEYPILAAHRHSANHREEILASDLCGCFHCSRTFHPREITEWVDEVEGIGTTAICPYCGVDSILGSRAGYPLTREFLDAMYRQWFEVPPQAGSSEVTTI
jgi:hypothetical protein